MIDNELLLKLETPLKEYDYKKIKQVIEEINNVDLAEVFDELSQEECAIIFRLLPKDQAAEVFSYLSTQRQRDMVLGIHEGLMNHIFDKLYFDDKIDFLEEMPANFVKKLIANFPPEERGMINQFLNYPDNSAGSLMTIEYVDLKKNMTVGQAFKRIRTVGMDRETIYNCYVLDSTRKLEGIVTLRKLVLSDAEATVEEIMDTNVIMVDTMEDQEEIADIFMKYDIIALPVVDKDKRLIGIITIDDIMDVVEQENTEDFQRMAAIHPTEEEYMEVGILKLAKNRVVWLLILMISATFTGAIIGRYEELLSTAVVLMTFVPMLMDSGGNAGAQASTLIIRGIAVGDIELKNWAIVLWKELRISLLVGVTLGVVNVLRMYMVNAVSAHKPDFVPYDAMTITTVSVTLMVTVVLAKVVGSMLPMMAKAVKLDPAIMAGPLITTIVDALSLIIYFSIASSLLNL